MSLDPETFADVIRSRLEALGTTVFAVESAHDLPPDTIRNVLRGGGKSGPTLKKVKQICEALGLELYVGEPREHTSTAHVLLDSSEYAHIPLHDALLAAGDGQQNHAEVVVDQLAFRRDWLKRIGLVASAARLARVNGDSMQPTLWPGDLVLIDTKKTAPIIRRRTAHDQRRAPVYAMIDNGEARLKRIERPADEVMMLISDNPYYPPELRQGNELADIRIIGKVVWWGHTAKE